MAAGSESTAQGIRTLIAARKVAPDFAETGVESLPEFTIKRFFEGAQKITEKITKLAIPVDEQGHTAAETLALQQEVEALEGAANDSLAKMKLSIKQGTLEAAKLLTDAKKESYVSQLQSANSQVSAILSDLQILFSDIRINRVRQGETITEKDTQVMAFQTCILAEKLLGTILQLPERIQPQLLDSLRDFVSKNITAPSTTSEVTAPSDVDTKESRLGDSEALMDTLSRIINSATWDTKGSGMSSFFSKPSEGIEKMRAIVATDLPLRKNGKQYSVRRMSEQRNRVWPKHGCAGFVSVYPTSASISALCRPQQSGLGSGSETGCSIGCSGTCSCRVIFGFSSMIFRDAASRLLRTNGFWMH